MHFKKCGSRWILRLDKGEELVETLVRFCSEQGVGAASVSGIGAADRLVLGYFETAAKKYHSFEREGDHEITALIGNVTTLEGRVSLHLHATVSDTACRAFGGHLSSARISGTCEVVLDPLEGAIGRKFDPDVGLNLLDL